jgi:hypothetical protein
MIAFREKLRTRIGSLADGKRRSVQDQFDTFAAAVKGRAEFFGENRTPAQLGWIGTRSLLSALSGLTGGSAFFEFFSAELFHLILALSILVDLAFLMQLSDRARNRSIVDS